MCLTSLSTGFQLVPVEPSLTRFNWNFDLGMWLWKRISVFHSQTSILETLSETFSDYVFKLWITLFVWTYVLAV